jgi:hypothetical protein
MSVTVMTKAGRRGGKEYRAVKQGGYINERLRKTGLEDT